MFLTIMHKKKKCAGNFFSYDLKVEKYNLLQLSSKVHLIYCGGEGRCSVVYSGETTNSAEPVALKFFR